MWKRRRLRFTLALMPAALICLSSCVPVGYSSGCPIYPVAGEKVAAELENANYSEFPNTWEWIGRIDKLWQELEVCNMP